MSTDLSDIRAALAAASSDGEWARWTDMDGTPGMHGLLMVGAAAEVIPEGEVFVSTIEPDGESPVAQCYTEEDASLIANAPAWLAELVDRVEAAENALGGILATVERHAYNCTCKVGGQDAISVDTDWLRWVASNGLKAQA